MRQHIEVICVDRVRYERRYDLKSILALTVRFGAVCTLQVLAQVILAFNCGCNRQQ